MSVVLNPHDHVVGAWAEEHRRYGTRLVWLCIRNGLDGTHRVEALQDEEQSPQLRVLHPVASVVSAEVLAWALASIKESQ